MLSDHVETIAAAYGLGSPTAPMSIAARGELGRVWQLSTDRGRYAVKETLFRQIEQAAAEDVAFQLSVLDAGTVRMPTPVRTRAGVVLADIGSHQVRVYTWMDLLAPDFRADPALVGETIAAVHRIRHQPGRELVGWYTDPVGQAGWAALLDAAVAAGAPFADALAAEIPYLLGLEATMETPRNLQNCHRDLWADNVLPTPGGALGIVDWENFGLEDPAHELAMPLLEFGGGDAERVGTLYRAYVDAGGPARLTGRGAFTMVIAQFGHFWEQDVGRFLDPRSSVEVRAHSLERIDVLVAEPLRLEHVDAVLDAVAGTG